MKIQAVSISILFTLILTLMGCKKEGESYEELNRLADLKIQEAMQLTKDRSCGNLSEWRIDTLYTYGYFPVHPSFEQDYKKLVKEANELFIRAGKLYNGPVPNTARTSMVVLPPHFGLRCADGKIKVMTANDFDLTEVNDRLQKLFPEIRDFFKEETCSSASGWYVTTIRKDCEFVPITYTDTKRLREFSKRVEEYAHLYYRKTVLDKSMNCPSVNDKPAKGVTCENGKPVVKY
ncbi:hypothetical protein [Sphingobacterium spiritivorum]|uniref:hypothetical protein n=1 Tax=Sphingobacterium spiritivorum TaxID=258 RepID=UPI0019181C2E|nr:hypothetical protein [Sphingobacterium spiritivorum]QQT27417.1 hypothetical protein I6J02_06075 [Sphingobacterium spiritivorum]